MQLEIVTPDSNLFSGEVEAIQLPGSEGSFGILNDHAAMIATLKAGVVKVTANNQDTNFDVNGGVVEVFNNKVIVLAE